ncbi:amidohydrolase family protein [Daejeonella sp. JGW-45]|uniref:amidohydrolase family protein n=1 Tax=Daejeonella sp. JGW-45 TaxID=3034148 RepID=UPI0023EE0529|nr:amidohydrolase family protein [Daejeonella sp. JGW-45]
MNLKLIPLLALTALASCAAPKTASKASHKHKIVATNHSEIPAGENTIAVINVNLIDGNGGKPVTDAAVLIKSGRIEAVGAMGSFKIPDDAQIVQGKGMSLLPGLIDSHFHLDRVKDLPALFLKNGVTSLRDPGAWIEAYAEERKSGKPMPRLFLTGPHLDGFPPAYPYDAFVVRDEAEAIKQVNDAADEGATAIKVYFRLAPSMIKTITEAAHKRGLPVTAHLESTEATQAVDAGLDGIEHITTFGLTLTPKREAEKYRQGMLADNNFRRQGRYETWEKLDINGPKADSLASFLVKKGTFVTPTLGAFEYQAGTGPVDKTKLAGFNSMKALTAKLNKAGVRLALGSHSIIAYAEKGWAFQREMEIWVESGISPSDVIMAATMENARFFRIDDQLGSIEKGKLADLVLVKGNPLEDIKSMRNVERVMVNGRWIQR